ncbi:MAG: hypothetical protein WA006_04470 [Rhodoglobus sp.]
MNAVTILKRVLLYGGLLAAAIATVGGVLGFLVVGPRGLVSALIGTGMAFVFLAVTAVSILLANRTSKSEVLSPSFFGIVLGGWLLKFVVFLVLVFLLKDQPWIDNIVLFLSIVAGVVGSLVVDLLVIAKARMPYVSDISMPRDSGRDDTP